jgi:hypothetical protein
VDEKLYAMGLAEDRSPLEEIYAPVWPGTLRTHATHLLPIGQPQGEGGDAGGGPRSDFRDVLLFRQVETDERGRAHVDFGLSDDLTSWHVSASAVSRELEVGAGSTLVPVGLPFFVDVVSAPEYLVGDEATIRVRAYGPALEAGDPVTFTVSAPSLGLAPVEVSGTAFRTIDVALPALTEGRHALTVEGRATLDGSAVADAVVRTIAVIPSRLEASRADYTTLEAGAAIPGGTGFTTMVVSDAGRGHFYPELVEMATSSGPRADQALAAAQARSLLSTWFAGTEEELPPATFDASQFQPDYGFVSLLPYSSGSEDLSFLVALAAPDAVDRESLRERFEELRWEEGEGLTRERELRAAAARAALGEDTVDELRAIGQEGKLTTTESLILALGLAEAGDHAEALAIERELVGRLGQRLGSWIRLWEDPGQGSTVTTSALERSAEQTALLSILAAGLGDDDVAVAADAYVRANPPVETLASLQRVAFVDRLIERSTAQPASFSWTLGEEAARVDLGPGESHRMVLTPGQRTSLELEPVSGSLGVGTSWSEPVDPATLTQDPSIGVERSMTPEGVIRAGDTVEVTIQVELGPDALEGCYLVTDLAPSGLAPVRDTAGWPRGRRGRTEAPDVIEPLAIDGQRVTFCVYRDEAQPVQALRYRARLVTPGTYAWEPTIVQSTEAPELRRLTAGSTVVLGR